MTEPAGASSSGSTAYGAPAAGFADASAGTFRWLFATEAGIETDGPPVSFADQDTAENWLEAHHVELAERGIGTVSLVDGEQVLYGPMFLEPDAPGPETADSAF